MVDTELSIANIPEFTISGISVRTNNRAEQNPETSKIAGLWNKIKTENVLNELGIGSEAGKIYAVYSDYENDEKGDYTLTAGIKTEIIPSDNDKFSTITVHGGRYLVFKVIGPLPESVINTWRYIWGYFEKNDSVKRTYISDFEMYSESEISIYIGII